LNFTAIGWLLVLVLSGCSSNIKVNQLDASYPANPENCEIQFYLKTMPTEQACGSLAKIEAHVQKNLFFGGRTDLEDDAYPELRAKACQLGGDVVVIDDHVTSTASEFSHLHVWASVLRCVK
jgi:hypothetical protein